MYTTIMTSFLFEYVSNVRQKSIVEDMYSRVVNDLFEDRGEMANMVGNMSQFLSSLKNNDTLPSDVLDCPWNESTISDLLDQINVQTKTIGAALIIALQKYNQINQMIKADSTLQKWNKLTHDGTADYLRSVFTSNI